MYPIGRALAYHGRSPVFDPPYHQRHISSEEIPVRLLIDDGENTAFSDHLIKRK
jgi:hypothetical protein